MNPFEASAEVIDCVRGRAALAAAHHLLVVTLGDVDTASLVAGVGTCATYRLPESSGGAANSSHEPWLPFADAAFDCVVLYRVTSHSVDIQILLGEASRVLLATGHVVVLEHHEEFAFAPLPKTGAAHMLHGWLRDAGFAKVDITERGGSQVIAVAHA